MSDNLEGFECARIDLLEKPLLVARGRKGFAACAYVDPATAEKLGEACVIFSGVSYITDFLDTEVKKVNTAAENLGISVGMSGRDAMEKLR
mmetsp:Transcript_13311/g.17780  ORF Transcript_13311/g.17780 Transcript_13311/m.17780 type:complete len:91 (-) Transcript_13311:1541-1813(-)